MVSTVSGMSPTRLDPPQLSRTAVLAVWAAAALPMGVLAWLVAPALAGHLAGAGNVPLAKALFICLTTGLVWQFVLVVVLVRREQGDLRWATVRDALWLRAPRSPRTGRSGGLVWLMVVPFILGTAVEEVLPNLGIVDSHDLGSLLESDAGQQFLHGAWGWFALIVVMIVFNTVLGEELLFRGYLLPRMSGAFGRADWVANGVLFAVYHLHMPWVIPAALLDMFFLAYPSKRYHSAWMGIAVHSFQSLVILVGTLAIVI